MKKITIAVAYTLAMITVLGGCSQSTKNKAKTDDPLTVYIWDNNMIRDVVPYIKEKLPNQEIEFLVGNNNVDLYNYLQEHGDLPDIITIRRFSEKDAQVLQPYLLDLGGYNIVSEYYPYALQYYTDSNQDIKWLPVCGIPETIIANKTLFDEYGIAIPKNYQEFADCCKKFHENGVKPYLSEVKMDWAAHSLFQGAAIDQFAGIKGIEWRSRIESSDESTVEEIFDDELWNQIIGEVHTFLQDTYLTEDDLEYDLAFARECFIDGDAAMFRGTPSIMEYLSSRMEDELVRLPYFSQTSDESWIYTYPSFNIALNSELEEDEEKLSLAMDVLYCLISEEGQKLVADGTGMISYSANVESDLNDMVGVEDQVESNAFYIRYASNNSFSASLQAVDGLLSGEDEKQVYAELKSELTQHEKEEPSVVTFSKEYRLDLNKKCGRDAASSILTTIRKDQGAQLAICPYYYYTSSIYAGSYTQTQIQLMIAHNDETNLGAVNLTGEQILALISQYFISHQEDLQLTSQYELPIASGMKLVVEKKEKQFELTGIEIDGQPIQENEQYDILLSSEMLTILQELYPDQDLSQVEQKELSSEWITAIKNEQQPSEPEDYIEVKDVKR